LQIDLFTFVAQIVNFIILLVLLRAFLYKPVINAMNEREEKIASRLQEAEEKQQEAEQERDTYRQKREEIDKERDDILSEAKQDADERREELLTNAREEIDDKRQQWYQALDHEKERFLRDLQGRVETQLITVIRQTLDKLADAELEQQMVRRFNQMIGDKDDNIADALDRDDGQLTVYSTFDLPQDQQATIRDTLADQIGRDIDVIFERDADLICGIILQTDDYRIGWNIQQYLESLEKHMRDMLEDDLLDDIESQTEDDETAKDKTEREVAHEAG